jgi:transketolase
VNGHSIIALTEALEIARGMRGHPTLVIAHTVKGKGISFMEANPDFHGRAPTPEEAERALAELEG